MWGNKWSWRGNETLKMPMELSSIVCRQRHKLYQLLRMHYNYYQEMPNNLKPLKSPTPKHRLTDRTKPHY